MANILGFLRAVLTDATEQQQFTDAPKDYVSSHGFSDLSGEDVTEAIRVLVRTLPPESAERLSPYTDDDGALPAVRTQPGEAELDAAVRQLQFAVSLSPAPVAADEIEEPAPLAANGTDSPEPAPEPRREADEPVVMQTEYESPLLTPKAASPGAADPYSAFGDELASIVRHAGDQMQLAHERAAEAAAAIIREAEREAAAVRDTAQTEAVGIRGNATQEAEGILQSARTQLDEAEAAKEEARRAQEEARREATDAVEKAKQESTTMLAEARARRDEIRAAEQELRKRLEGVNSVFESLQGSVVPDEI